MISVFLVPNFYTMEKKKKEYAVKDSLLFRNKFKQKKLFKKKDVITF